MAELWFNDYCRRTGKTDLIASSAGLCAYPGNCASVPVLEVMGAHGIDASRFRSRRFTPYLAEENDCIAVMTASHLEAVKMLAPEAAPKCRLLSRRGEIPDPFGENTAGYRRTFEFMRPEIEALAEELATQN